MDRSYLGNLKYNAGQDFNVIVSNASFESLKKFKDWASDSDNGGATNNGLGTNIKNSFIICSPQQTDDEVTISTDIQKINYRESGNASGYQKGDDELIDSTTISTTNMTMDKRDTGAVDLIVTDHLGNLIRLTPPFTDIDTTYFSVKEGILTSDMDVNNNTMYGCRALTFNKEYSKLLSETSSNMSTLSSTYTPIINYINRDVENEDGTKNNDVTYSTVAYWYENEKGNKIWTAVSYNQTPNGPDEDFIKFIETYSTSNTDDKSAYHTYSVSFIELLNSYYLLKKEHDALAYKYEQANNANEKGSIAYNVKYMMNLLANNVMYKANGDMPSYIWTGNNNNYTTFSYNKTDNELNSYIFIHQM